MKTTNRKNVCEHLAKEAGLFITKDGCIKLSFVDKDYFALAESEIITRFEKWDECLWYLRGYLAAKGAHNESTS